MLFVAVERSLDLQESLDPEEWAAIMDRFVGIVTDEVRRFEGSVESSTGDGITAVFGVPLALEDHAQRSARAALKVFRSVGDLALELRRTNQLDFQVCIGLSSGEAVVDRAGDEVRLDSTASGRTSGLAQRMADLAEPGRLYVTEQTARLLRATFDVRDLGLMTVRALVPRCRCSCSKARPRPVRGLQCGPKCRWSGEAPTWRYWRTPWT